MSKSTKRRVPSTRRPTPNRSTSPRPAASTRSHRGAAGVTNRPTTARPTRFRSRHPLVAALAPVAIVLAIIATMVLVKATSSSSSPASSASHLTSGAASGSADTTALASNVAASLSVPEATLDSIGHPSSVIAPSPTGDSGPIPHGVDGKAIVTYIGAEWCPYCAAERWAIAVALSRFGSFSDLSATHSSTSDAYPDTRTLSFYGSHYSSPYLDFVPVEEATNQAVDGSYPTLERPTAAEAGLMARFDPQGSIPFVDIANKYVVVGASYSPQVLAGLSQGQIANQLKDPSSPVAQAIDGAANVITASIVKATGQQPGRVASSSVIASIVKSLGS